MSSNGVPTHLYRKSTTNCQNRGYPSCRPRLL
jgi:hypothetical protein